MLSIATKHVPPTDTKGGFIRVTVSHNRRITNRGDIPFDYAASDAHEAAIREVLPDVQGLTRTDETPRGYKWTADA